MFWYLATVGYVYRVSQCKGGGMFWYLATVGYVHRVSQCKGGHVLVPGHCGIRV